MNKLSLLRKAGIAEGISFLLLLLVAMPLKYLFDLPIAVKVMGWIHGILFVTFVVLAWEYKTDRNKSMKWMGIAFIAAFVPLGTFWFDKTLRKEEANIQAADSK